MTLSRPGATRIVAAVLAIVLLLAGAATAISLLIDDSGAERQGGDEASRDAAPDSGSPAPTGEPEPGATEPPDPALAPYYSQELEWSSCGEHECAELTVPLDYDEPDGETIELALLRVPAADPEQRKGSLVVNPGGPGAPGTQYAAQARAAFGEPLLAAFDIVGFDPRGTGESAPVDCLTDAQLDDYIATDPSPDTAAERRKYVRWTEAIGDGCVQRSPGELAAHVSTVEAARDIDVLRAALGEAELSYFGASYGTKLGATYAELFPDRVGRLVLDGAVDPTLTTRELNLGQAAGFERALRAYATDCVEQDCALGDSVAEVLEAITGVLERVDEDPLPAGDRQLRVGNAFYGIVLPLYQRDAWFVLTQALLAAQRGDGSVLLRLSDLYTSRGADGYTDNSAEAIYAINCLDDPSAIPAAAVQEQVPAFERVSPTFGEVFAWSLTGCGGIEVESDAPEPEIDAAGADPIVVVGTTRDPATPYEWSVALAEQLESGVLVTRDGDGHTGYNAGNDCVDAAVESYLLEGAVPDDGLRC
jgi:pimeloyl-ACP methyl ester carboxylesterase